MIRAATKVVTLTVTEKGYCLGADGALDLTHPDIQSDLAAPEAPVSAIGWLVEALRRRRAAGSPAFDVVSCDNLSGNGDALSAAVFDLALARDPELARWIAGSARFPNTMVDSITPATDEALSARVREAVGLEDADDVMADLARGLEALGSPALPRSA